MTQTQQLLDYARQQRRQVGTMENTLSKAISTLIELDHMEDACHGEGNSNLQRGIAHNKAIAKEILVRHAEEGREYFMRLQEFCEALPSKYQGAGLNQSI